MRSMRAACLLSTVVLALAIPEIVHAQPTQTVRVTGSRLNVRSEPAVDAAVLAVVSRGDVLQVRGTEGDWLVVQIPNSSQTGYVHRSFVTSVAPRATAAEPPEAGPPSSALPPPAPPAAARPASPGSRSVLPRFTVTADYILGFGTSSLAGSTHFSLYEEDTGRLDESYSFDKASGFSFGARVRVYQALGFEASYSVAKRDGTASLALDLPHPLYLDQLRSLTPTTAAPTVKENAFHVGIFAAGDTGRLRAGAYAGPSFYSVKADVLSQVTFTQAYPYDVDSVTITGAPLTTISNTAVGLHAGAFAEVVLHPNVGIGVDARFTRATVDIQRPVSEQTTEPDDPTAPRPVQPNTGVLQLDVGSFQILGGVRLYF